MRRLTGTQAFATSAALFLALGASSCMSAGAYKAQVTPQRPTFSNDTRTASFGTMELEAGLEIGMNPDPGQNAARLDTVARFGVSETGEFFLGWTPYQSVDASGPDPDGTGDLEVGFRQRLMDETESLPATAFQISTEVPTGDDDLAVNPTDGRTAFNAAFIADRSFGDLSTTLFYQLGVLSSDQAFDQDITHLLAVAGSLPVDDLITAQAELAWFYFPETDEEPIFLTLLGQYSISDTMMFDAGLRLGLNDDAQDVSVFAGIVTNLGRLF
ncbi:MAG: transporter family protein [Planctomycetota bacterium]|jgi:hypothetical protein